MKITIFATCYPGWISLPDLPAPGAAYLVLTLIGPTSIPDLVCAFISKVKELIKLQGQADHLNMSINVDARVAYRSTQFVAAVISRLPVELNQTGLSR